MKKFIRVFGKWLALAVWILAAGFCYSCGRQEQEILLTEEEVFPEMTKECAAESETLLFVHVCGEVNNPGVYELHQGQRIYEAVELAGGFTAEAADAYLNLAEPVVDGMKIEVPDQEEEKALRSSAQALETGQMKVNLNTAAKEQLMTLKGIGASRAEDIIRYRQEHGNFEKEEDIMRVPGIKEAAFQKIKEDITVSP
ncbi:MAG: helix-hairpin-helix domain-containing protein [Brotaphodocola sp.]